MFDRCTGVRQEWYLWVEHELNEIHEIIIYVHYNGYHFSIWWLFVTNNQFCDTTAELSGLTL